MLHRLVLDKCCSKTMLVFLHKHHRLLRLIVFEAVVRKHQLEETVCENVSNTKSITVIGKKCDWHLDYPIGALCDLNPGTGSKIASNYVWILCKHLQKEAVFLFYCDVSDEKLSFILSRGVWLGFVCNHFTLQTASLPSLNGIINILLV